MRLITSALALAILAGVGFCQPPCKPYCADEYTRCNTKNNWYPENCDREKVRDHCQLMCGECRICDDTEDTEDTEDTTDEDSGSDKSFGYPIHCPAPIEEFDSNGYRLAFRHTGQEIDIDQFFQLYATGEVDAFFPTCPQSQYRDPNLHFFWEQTDGVVLDIFDLEGNHAAYINFDIPLGSNHPSWRDIYKWEFIRNAGDQFYHDIHSGGEIDMEFKAGNKHRNLYTALSHGGCDNDLIWFSVLNNEGVCWWDKIYSKSTKKDKTTIVYSPYNNAAHTLTSLAVASRFELRLRGDFSQDPQNGFRKVLRYPNNAGVDFMDFYESGITNSLDDRYSARAGDVRPGLFRSESFENDISNAQSVMLVVYDTNGNVDEALTFRGSNNLFDWFSKGNLVSTLKWKLQENDYNFFSISGDAHAGRRLFINKSYFGCGLDFGFLVVSCLPTDEDQGICGWEDFSGGKKEHRKELCAIMYTPSADDVRWDSRDYLISSGIEIFVR